MHAMNCDGPDDLGTPSCPGTTATSHGVTTTTHATVLPETLSSVPSAAASSSTTAAVEVKGETITSVPSRSQPQTLPFTGVDPLLPLVGGVALVVGALCARVQRRQMRGLRDNP